MTQPPLRLYATYQAHVGNPPDWIVTIPDREMWIAAELSNDHTYTLIAPDIEARTVFDRRSAKRKETLRRRPLPRWARYAAGALITVSEKGLDVPGLTAVVLGNEPEGPRYHYSAGMAFAALWYDHNQQAWETATLLEIMEQVRKNYID